jgi:hypothetical protein
MLLDGLEGVAWVAKTSKAVATLAQIKVVTILALPANATDSVQTNVTVDIGVYSLVDY